MATENGVYRFLGSGFERFGPDQGIADVDVLAIVVDSDDRVWAGTLENLYRWDGERFVPAGSQPIPITAMNRMVVEDTKHLLIVEHQQLYRLEHDDHGRMLSYLPVFSTKLLRTSPELTHLSSVAVVPGPRHGNQVWLGCEKKLCSWNEEKPSDPLGIVSEWGPEQGLVSDDWQDVLLDRAGTLWAGARHHIAAIAGGASHFQAHSIPSATRSNHDPFVYAPFSFAEDHDGRILVPSEDGIARWDGAHWSIIGRANGLQLTGRVIKMVFDDNGDLWLATRGDGLYNWAGYENWEGWNDERQLPSLVTWAAGTSSDGRLLLGTDKGPAWIDPKSGDAGPLFKGRRWPYGQVDGVEQNQDGSFWAETFSSAVVRAGSQAGAWEQRAKLPAFITRSVENSAGQVFITTAGGIYSRSTSDSREVPRRIDAVTPLLGKTAQVDAGCESPSGTMWFLTGRHLLRLQGGHWSVPPIDGLSSDQGVMLDLSCAPDGSVWITGQQSGTWKFTPESDRLTAWQLVVPSDLQALTPAAIMVDRRGWVWLGTDAGVLVWNGLSWRHLTQESGLIWNDVDQGVILAAPDGSIWIGTSGGVAHLLHPERVFDSVPLTALISGIRQGNESYPATQELKLPWSAVPLQFQVSSPDLMNRSDLIFKYRMDGLQKNWVESRDGTAVFSNLPPGNYTFTALATNSGINASSSIFKIRVVILPPWWKTNWFYGFCGLVSISLIVAFDRIRARRSLEKRKRLEGIVLEKTSELLQSTLLAQELEASREALRIQANHDGLTGLLNHAAIIKELDAELDRSRRENRTLVIAMADLDHFKRINDVHGHLAGDEALRAFARAVGSATRVYDHAGRCGGEEFLLILTEIPLVAVEQRLRALHSAISGIEVRSADSIFAFTCSIGATIFDPFDGPSSADELLAIADRALYTAKSSGRNRVVLQHAVLQSDTSQGSPTEVPAAD